MIIRTRNVASKWVPIHELIKQFPAQTPGGKQRVGSDTEKMISENKNHISKEDGNSFCMVQIFNGGMKKECFSDTIYSISHVN